MDVIAEAARASWTEAWREAWWDKIPHSQTIPYSTQHLRWYW